MTLEVAMNNRKFIYGSAFAVLSLFLVTPLLSNNGNDGGIQTVAYDARYQSNRLPAKHPPIAQNQSCASCHGNQTSPATNPRAVPNGKFSYPSKKGR